MEQQKKTTIKDIANVLGITPSAVSKALNNHPRISNETKLAVKQIAKNLNYQPNHLASALRKGKSNLVGVIVPRANSNFFSSVLENIEEVLNKEGYNVIISQSNESYDKECKSIDTLLHTQVDGIIASLANETVNFAHFEKIKRKGIPLILYDRGDNDIDVDYIGIDDFDSSHRVVKHLVKQKCKRIAHIGGYRHTRIFKNRILGFIDALNKYGLPTNNELILEGDLTLEDGRKKMESLLNLPEPPDAVYAASDYAALGALQVMQEHGIQVPEEIALVGFSNEPFTSLLNPSISTVNQHSGDIGKRAAETFLKRVQQKNWTPKLTKNILKSELIIRDSSNRKVGIKKN
ncbi:LacI family DNA-binding transcriptional regulator [Maribacter sp. HTCC2170]|uniref:LacI family DNA-binding transcriptional regulator n=1 Tax=Maribacter sp. (strain HTCC2170 / KCCM 42371) TaxID=313603 RepID=UPI00006B47DE|nr:LacI family DNA-binding transcriptional regulator [Maribacter sp. HTCC2170]EAR01859.1 LacI family transcriptional regulator [Maribacter sp. HTCC2170]